MPTGVPRKAPSVSSRQTPAAARAVVDGGVAADDEPLGRVLGRLRGRPRRRRSRARGRRARAPRIARTRGRDAGEVTWCGPCSEGDGRAPRTAGRLWGGQAGERAVAEQVAVVEAVGLEHGAAVGVEPVGARAVVVELDAVAVGVVEVDGDRAAVVGAVVDRVAVVEQPADGAAELAPVGVQERDVVEAGVAGRRRRRRRRSRRCSARCGGGSRRRRAGPCRARARGRRRSRRSRARRGRRRARGRGRRRAGARGRRGRRGGWLRRACGAVSRRGRAPASVRTT